ERPKEKTDADRREPQARQGERGRRAGPCRAWRGCLCRRGRVWDRGRSTGHRHFQKAQGSIQEKEAMISVKTMVESEVQHISDFIEQNPDVNTAVLDGVVARLGLLVESFEAGEEQVTLRNGMVVQRSEIENLER